MYCLSHYVAPRMRNRVFIYCPSCSETKLQRPTVLVISNAFNEERYSSLGWKNSAAQFLQLSLAPSLSHRFDSLQMENRRLNRQKRK